MNGMLKRPDGRKCIMRSDHGFKACYWAWSLNGIIDPGGRARTYKWKCLPKGCVTIFNIDSPPDTVSWNPLL